MNLINFVIVYNPFKLASITRVLHVLKDFVAHVYFQGTPADTELSEVACTELLIMFGNGEL